MKIIQILPELNAGGVERGTLEIGRALVQKGHDSLVISNGGRLVNQLEQEGTQHIQLPVHKKRLSSLKQVKALRVLFEKEKPNIIHLRSRLPAWLAYLAWRAMNPLTRPRLVTTVHGFNSANAYSAIMTKGERVICVSNSVRKYVLENYPKVAERDIRVIHRGIDPQVFSSSYKASSDWIAQWHSSFPETKNKKLLTLPGRITRLKGHEDFLEMLSMLSDEYHGVIAGGAHAKKVEYFDELKKRSTEMGLSKRITFAGHRSDLRELLSHSDFVFSLSQKPESFGRTTLESLCLRTPVIGYEHGGVGEILDELFPQGKVAMGSVHALAAKVREFSISPVYPKQHNPFLLDTMLRETLNTYSELCAES